MDARTSVSRDVRLLEPLATSSFGSDLHRVARGRPVLALLAGAGTCNANHSALPSLHAAGVDVVAVGEESTHFDADGENGDAVGGMACGTPQLGFVEGLRARAAQLLSGVSAQSSR